RRRDQQIPAPTLMLISCDYTKYLGYDPKTKMLRYQYKIVDTDFEEVGADAIAGLTAEVGVIETYRKKHLPVVPNLIKAWQYNSKKYGYSMYLVIEWSREYNPYFPEYEDEINKYLLLL